FDEEIPAGALLSLGTGRALATRAGLAPVGDRAAWSVETSALVRRIDGIAIDIAQPTAWERVRLTLEIEENGRIQSRLSGLGLSEAHARSFSKLPDDHALFAPLSQSWVPSPDDEWIRAVRSPRFPVAGGRRHPRVVPLGLAGIELDSTIARARVDERDRAVRDGVAHFERSLFLDPALERERVGSLRSLIEGRLYAAATPSAPLGLYALWPVAEVALVAVPDAAHRAWAVMPAEAPPSLTTPVLEAVSPTHLAWTESIVVGGAGTPTYRLEAADRPDGEARAQLARGEDRTFTIAEGEGCSGLRHYRVRAELGALHSAWSNEVALRPSSVDFDPCAEPTLHAPVLTVHEGSPPTADTAVEWVAEGDTTYRLELAGDAEMSAPRVVFEGPAPTPAWIDLPTGADRVEWVRIRAERERTIGPWSAAVAVGGTARATALVLEDRGRYGLGTPSTRDVLVAVQRALLRLSAARGDVVAVLSLPQHYREAETSEHLSILLGGASATQVPAPTEAEARALAPSGALYHPWLRVDAGPGHAPDGTIVGMIAARTIARGAWVAPANTALAEITGAQRIGDAFATEMLEQGVNLITQTPRGFLPRGARTLARGTELSELSVVRLGHLIRRLIERDGPRYAFEPNDLGLSRRIEDDLSELLGRLHQLGAFRGRSASDAFRVVADDRVNRVEDRERGRFVVELSYAPSMPLQFLTVRLVGSARGGLELVGVST
ncbi:hypothetical protein L6R52_12970, partial [Myxococcota bacterium]|nr:hypothetical protein [Myxococcota bacterium]